MQIIESPKVYDAVIVGSGAGGGMATKILADAGLNVAVIEAGPFFDPKEPSTMTQMKWPWESPRRGRATGSRHFGDFDMAYGGWTLPGEPITMKDDTEFLWFRSRMLGGRTNHWGRISLRFGPKDFKHKSIDGLGDDWPISYEDVKPYYDKLDKLVGVFGSNEGLPNDPDGFFLPAPKPRLHELYYIKAARKLGIPVIPSRLSILTKKLNEERGVCFYCNQCSRSCNVYADFSSGSCLIFPAQKANEGQVDLYVNSMVRSVEMGSDGKAKGVSYINKEDGTEHTIRGKVVVLAASACSSARILLNSKSPGHMNGLGNSSGVVGKYLHDSTGSSRAGFIPALMDRKIYNEDGVGGMHVYSPWWGDNSKLDFKRGYHIEIWGGMGMPNYGFGMNMDGINEFAGFSTGGYGDKLREDAKRYYGAVLGFGGRGECIAREDNYCELDPEVVDEWGIPVLRFNYSFSDQEKLQAKHMHQTFEELIDAMGGKVFGDTPTAEQNYGLNKGGEIIHEVGTTRMGNDPKTSVCNKYQQLHDVDNVFITDGGPFVSQADKNCTWTIMALAWRASDYIVDQLKKQNI